LKTFLQMAALSLWGLGVLLCVVVIVFALMRSGL
jgi:hypothetical protein